MADQEYANTDLQQSLKDWSDLTEEYVDLQDLHKKYTTKLEELISLQKKCVSGVKHQRYRLKAIKNMMSHVDLSKSTNPAETVSFDNLSKDLLARRAQLSQIDDTLPGESGTYLKVILGNINVSILDKKAKYDYKDQYERFKLGVNLVAWVMAMACLYFNNHILDLIFMFVTVWYYCTLTIRESILRVNGSRIRGWWRVHHIISTVAGGVILVWPNSLCYQLFRVQMFWFNVYVAFLQYLQFAYQRGVIYRLRSLGETVTTDITIDGFQSWMWKGLGFLLPFLFAGYIFQLYNSYSLYLLSSLPEATWHVPCLSLLLAILGIGNIITTSSTIPAKIAERRKGLLKLRFIKLDKLFGTNENRDSIQSKKPERQVHDRKDD